MVSSTTPGSKATIFRGSWIGSALSATEELAMEYSPVSVFQISLTTKHVSARPDAQAQPAIGRLLPPSRRVKALVAFLFHSLDLPSTYPPFIRSAIFSGLAFLPQKENPLTVW
jgi:hypothetical protein